MRPMRWSEMDEAARTALCARGLGDIFDPALRASIVTLIEDVRARGDAAVCEALARFDGITLAPSQLRVTADEIASASVTPDVDAALDDAIAHCRAFNEQLMARAVAWSFEPEPGLRVGEKIGPIASAGLFVPSGKASYPSVAYQLGVPATVAGVPQVVVVVPPIPGATDPWTRPSSPSAASSASTTSSASTAPPGSPRWRSAPSRSPRCARSSARARRR